jgi:hypothetical protein
MAVIIGREGRGRGAAGWSVIIPSASTRYIYLSSSEGNNNNSGFSSVANFNNVGGVAAPGPVRTLGQAKTLLRNGFSDWILARKDDVFNEAFGSCFVNGLSGNEPMVFTSYHPTGVGTAHPRGTGTGARPKFRVFVTAAGEAFFFADSSNTGGNNIAFVGLHLDAYNRATGYPGRVDTTSLAFRWLVDNFTWCLIEDCKVEHFEVAINPDVFSATPDAIMYVRRNVIVDQLGDGQSQGYFIEGICPARLSRQPLRQ